MNTTIDAAQDLLSNAHKEIKATMAGASDEAKAAVASITPQDSNLHSVLSTSSANGHNEEDPASRARLQVVDEVRVPQRVPLETMA